MKHLRHFACCLLAAIALSLPAHAQRELRPVDQAAQQPDFFTFRAQLLVALARRDIDAILSVLHKDIANSFGGSAGGVEEFKELWQPQAKDSKVWATLTTVLALGGAFKTESIFMAPYVSSQWPLDINAFEHTAVIASSVRVRTRPTANSATITQLSFAVVELGEVKDGEAAWFPVRLPDGKLGYIDRRYLRSPIDYRAKFEKIDGRWQMTSFLAGD